jgi:hypothetical protein
VKKYFLIASIVLIVLSLACFLTLILIPTRIRQETTLVSYEQTSNFSYLIYLKPSYIYGPDPQTPPPNSQYPLSGVGSIDFSYSFSLVAPGPSSAYIEAVLENPGIWQKKINLAPDTSAAGDLTLSFSLDPNRMNSLFDAIEKETGITASQRVMTLNAHITAGGDSLVQSLPVTLDNNLVEISGNLNQSMAIGIGKFKYVVNRSQGVPDEYSYEINTAPAPASVVSPAAILGPGQTAFTRLIDKMNVTFSYQFLSDQAVNDLNTEVNINAVIEDPGVWSRKFPLLQTSKSGNFSLTFPVDLATYIALLQSIYDETGVSSNSYNISISAVLHTTGETKFGKIDEVFSPSLKAAIAGNIAQWNKNLTTNQPGFIKATSIISNPQTYFGLSAVWSRTLSAIGGIIFLILCGLSLVLYFKMKPARRSQTEQEADRIRKKYGVRLVEALNYAPSEGEKTLSLGSMEDLIKVADELSKPIIYQPPDSIRVMYAYFVLDGSTRYQYLLEAGLREPEKKAEKDPLV